MGGHQPGVVCCLLSLLTSHMLKRHFISCKHSLHCITAYSHSKSPEHTHSFPHEPFHSSSRVTASALCIVPSCSTRHLASLLPLCVSTGVLVLNACIISFARVTSIPISLYVVFVHDRRLFRPLQLRASRIVSFHYSLVAWWCVDCVPLHHYALPAVLLSCIACAHPMVVEYLVPFPSSFRHCSRFAVPSTTTPLVAPPATLRGVRIPHLSWFCPVVTLLLAVSCI